RYLYLVPGFTGDPKRENEYCAHVISYDTRAPFKETRSYEMADVKKFLGADVGCYDGASFDGRFVYFAPLYNRVAIQYDTQGTLDDSTRWQKFDMSRLGAGSVVGTVFDGHYLYYCAYAGDNIVRFDTSRAFTNPSSWQS